MEGLARAGAGRTMKGAIKARVLYFALVFAAAFSPIFVGRRRA